MLMTDACKYVLRTHLMDHLGGEIGEEGSPSDHRQGERGLISSPSRIAHRQSGGNGPPPLRGRITWNNLLFSAD